MKNYSFVRRSCCAEKYIVRYANYVGSAWERT